MISIYVHQRYSARMSVLLGSVDHIPLKRMPEPLRSFWAEVRRKERDSRALAARKQSEIDRRRRRGDGQRLCRACCCVKPIEQFVWKGDGFRAECTPCFRRLMAQARQRSPYREREQERKRTDRLVRQGKLVKTPCEHCGKRKVQKHHKLWDGSGRHIKWLCQKCHDAEHRRVGKRSSERHDYRRPISPATRQRQAGRCARTGRATP